MSYDFVVIGAGIVGLSVERELKTRQPEARIALIEKEHSEARHASGRNSGVLHAGFYYTADSLKAKFTRDGNRLMKEYCRDRHIPLNECGKLVVARNGHELRGLEELKKRGDTNGVELHWLTEQEASEKEPNVRTLERALFSPATASVDPTRVCAALVKDLKDAGVKLMFGRKFESYSPGSMGKIETDGGPLEAGMIVNCAGLYSDKVAKEFGIGQDYCLLPFKGIYLMWTGQQPVVKMNVYPVPDLKYPFLGVHFTITSDNHVKIGPTAIPAFWRENYDGFSRFDIGEAGQIMRKEAKLFFKNAFGFRDLAREEMRKYRKPYMVECATSLVKKLPAGGWEWGKPGIRAQLVNKKTLKLEQDFIVEKAERSLHVLNAVSPGFTCAFPMASHICEMLSV